MLILEKESRYHYPLTGFLKAERVLDTSCIRVSMIGDTLLCRVSWIVPKCINALDSWIFCSLRFDSA